MLHRITLRKLWLNYLDALESVDTSSAPDIEWPIPPGGTGQLIFSGSVVTSTDLTSFL
ncbi:TPA: tail fiber assembly protein [Salmonella enterica]|uniref:Tail fiber assembly protein n=1 Tax=Salmonella enterica TaxID=28901 RepID=A0A749PSM4_SALER|nr:tail fiber assembly protein [Salmonella enterica]